MFRKIFTVFVMFILVASFAQAFDTEKEMTDHLLDSRTFNRINDQYDGYSAFPYLDSERVQYFGIGENFKEWWQLDVYLFSYSPSRGKWRIVDDYIVDALAKTKMTNGENGFASKIDIDEYGIPTSSKEYNGGRKVVTMFQDARNNSKRIKVTYTYFMTVQDWPFYKTEYDY